MSGQTINQALSRLVLDAPFYGAVALSTPMLARDDIPTAATDGSKIFYNPAFFASLPLQEVVFVIAHEVEHIVRLHTYRRQSRNPELWNIACDHGINLDLKACGFHMPKNGLADFQYKGMSAEQVYNRLQQEGNDGASSDGDLLEPSESEHDVKGRIQSAANIVKARSGRGSIPAHLAGLIDGLSQPRVDWRYVLRDFMTATAAADYSWSRLNRRVRHRGLRLPSLHSTAVGGIGVIIDTSGSVHSYIPAFLSELQGIAGEATPERIIVYFIDTQVQVRIETTADAFDADMGENMTRPPYGGGTDLRPAFDALELDGQLDAVVVLTDMDTPWPTDFTYAGHTLVVNVGEERDAPFGRTIQMEA